MGQSGGMVLLRVLAVLLSVIHAWSLCCFQRWVTQATQSVTPQAEPAVPEAGVGSRRALASGARRGVNY